MKLIFVDGTPVDFDDFIILQIITYGIIIGYETEMEGLRDSLKEKAKEHYLTPVEQKAVMHILSLIAQAER